MKSRCILFVLVGLLFPLQAFTQKITVRSVKSIQAYAPMQGRTGEIVQSLPGERVIEKETVNDKTLLYCVDKAGKRMKIYEGGLVDYFTHSREGERICFSAQGMFVVKDVITSKEFRIETVDPVYARFFANISPDGQAVIFNKSLKKRSANYSANDYLIVTRNLGSQEDRVIGKGECPKWSANSQQIVFGIGEGHLGNWTSYLWVMNSDGTEARKLTSSMYMDGWYVKWSPDGRYVMDSDRKGNLRIVNVAKDEAVVILPSDLGKIAECRKSFFSAEWSSDSKTILAQVLVEREITEEIAGWELYMINVDGSEIEQIEVPGLGMVAPVWMNSGKLLYRNSQRGNVWDEVTVRSDEQ